MIEHLRILELPGQQFLGIYVPLSIATVMAAMGARYILRFPAEALHHRPNLDPYEVAYLKGGHRRMNEAALAALVMDKLVIVQRDDGKAYMHGGQPRGLAPALSAICDTISGRGGSINIGSLIGTKHKESLARVEGRLDAYGLMPQGWWRIAAQAVPATMLSAVLLLGLAKMQIGYELHRPIGFLVVITLILAVVTLFFLFNGPKRSLRGDKVLRDLTDENDTLRAVAAGSGQLHTSDLAMAAGLFGLGALGASQMEDLRTAYRKYANSDSGFSFDGGSSSSSDSGGSSCGGGCGGGGCGGCGG